MTMKPGTLWAVTDGAYSDYRVQAVFEREDDANAAMQAGLGDDVCEMPHFPAGVRPKQVMVYRAHATAHRKGRLADVAVRQFSNKEWNLGGDPAPRRPRVRENRWRDGSAIGVTVECANAELGLKALHDRLAQIYAEWAGIAS